jgi:hypothetical protein
MPFLNDIVGPFYEVLDDLARAIAEIPEPLFDDDEDKENEENGEEETRRPRKPMKFKPLFPEGETN